MATYRGGFLTRLADKRGYSSPDSIKSSAGIKGRDVRKQDQEIYIVINKTLSRAAMNLILSYYVARFYTEEGHHDINRYRLTCAVAGIIGNSCDYNAITPWQNMKNAFKTTGINLIINPITFREFRVHADQDERLREFLANWEDDQGYMLGSTQLPLIYAGAIILAMFENLNTNNYIPWFKKRIETFAGTLGDDYTPQNTSDGTLPELFQLQRLQGMASAYHEMKKRFYFEIVAIGQQPTTDCALVFAETPLLRGLKERYAAAIKELKKYKKEDMMYVKILATKDDCAMLNGRVFSQATIVASAIAQFVNSTYKSYNQSSSESSLRTRSIITNYLINRTSLSALAAGENDMENMGPTEK
ncbi:unnamed protein product [Phaedon cochleariae]|uniref:Nucleocapsid protein n=1 Tax=Phaedon cochleariae TaxID=80249 RepID=A0A9N9S9V3_PHACE|nr:unnamed protein product [Phaedon cochleariae]